ncbi:MAG TPA: S41 family peptidase [Gemmatimonadaceae bacterium]|nr:S41 family peptidase [Gemmatimonadaceae bacterium]
MKRHRNTALAVILCLPLLAGGFMLQERSSREGARLFDQVMTLVSERFVDTLDRGTLYERAARGLIDELNDPYTQLLSPREYQRFNTTTGGRYGGIGMQIEDQQGTITVSRVFPHTPAENAGVIEGDRIVAVEGTPTRGWRLDQTSDSLLGTPGTKVNVRFQRPGVNSPINVQFTRAVITIPAVPFALMLDGGIGYVPLQQFNESASGDLEREMTRMVREGARGFILDLRGNTGGILDQALEVSNLFLRQNQEIASIRGRGLPAQRFVTEKRPAIPTTPLIILTDGQTASASEIVAGALQDHDRALIVGTTSFGKGLVQNVWRLDGGYALKMTTAKWFTPTGRSIQKERIIGPEGRFVEVDPDSSALERLRARYTERGDTAPATFSDDEIRSAIREARPEVRTDGGRTVYGGGAITPDVIVSADTFSTGAQALARSVAPQGQLVYVGSKSYALELKPAVTSPDFTISQAWRDELYRRLTAAGVTVDRTVWNEGAEWVDYQLGRDLARVAFGDTAAKKRDLASDAQLRRAIELLGQGRTQEDLFVIAQGTRATGGR